MPIQDVPIEEVNIILVFTPRKKWNASLYKRTLRIEHLGEQHKA
jgi:hypothetical protein